MTPLGLAERFRTHAAASRILGEGPLIVAVSGGLDSMTLLYLLRFTLQIPPNLLTVAHVDHKMRPGSAEDAAWLDGICQAWQIRFYLQTASVAVDTEAEGREIRYRFFSDLKDRLEAEAVLTGHTADDQAETVLFRIARGAGPAGLEGIRGRLETGVVRPFLPFWRSEVEQFARERDIPFREDLTNAEMRWARNRIRRDVLPALEAVVPGARKALVHLARSASGEQVALTQLTDAFLEGEVRWDGDGDGGAELDVASLNAHSDALLTQLLRRICSRVGASPGRDATQTLVDFVRKGRSGKRVELGGRVVAERSLGVIRIASATGSEPVSPVGTVVLSGREGSSAAQLGSRRVEVAWGARPMPGYPLTATFNYEASAYPFTLRPWRPGDRIRIRNGNKKVKKVLAEKRVPTWARQGVPVLIDDSGAVVWIPGIWDHDYSETPDVPGERFYVGIRYASGGKES